MRGATVAKKKPTAKRVEKRYAHIQLRVSAEYREWLGRLAERERAGLSEVIDWALEAYAKSTGFEDPPKR